MAVDSRSEINGSDLITALKLSQQAPSLLHSATPESVEEYARLEQLFLACLRTGDDKSAQACLTRLSQRFGPSNERVIGLRGLYEEAVAGDHAALEKCLTGYEQILADDPVNVPILKRRVALLRSLKRPADAITALIQLLDAIPTDAEAWCELSDLYQSQGLSPQAIFSLEEALLIAPNAWNIHARMGELLYVSALAEGKAVRLLSKSVQHFCRSIELCDDYLRGLYGLVLAASQMLESVPEDANAGRLKAFGLKRLGAIVQARTLDEQNWASSRSELIAAKELLNCNNS
ncbi:hypothetical protein N7510_002353 [Penicillium lagena]|uniref:uncharacterized protein n=1 Tax=Penicillium lagena TaxID=94218 RepID=UPI002541FC2C|nr:uncharacterized protein N7510_002353 [Penicillium lagena]KAJ5626044.1 hypothetical protein N7510_002353 [Penicillium lagena]